MAIRGIAPEDVVVAMVYTGGVNEEKRLCIDKKLLIKSLKKKFQAEHGEVLEALKRTISFGAIEIKDSLVVLLGGG